MLRRSLIIAAILAFATGCTTIKGIFGDKASKALEPAELVEIESPIAVKPSWTRKLGDGNAALRASPRAPPFASINSGWGRCPATR